MGLEFFAPWLPGASDGFDERKAAHLLRRTGFGAPADDVRGALEKGLEAAVEGVFLEDEEEEQGFQRTFEAVNGTLVNFGDIDEVRAWWLHRILRTRVPLSEKLTLFWHGHFATSAEKVESSRLMHQQIETIRKHALGNFRDLVLAMAKDPAMLVWLDGESNTREHPNENFARELMELFTCGIGHYTEHDVLEAARAFTGWHRAGAEFAFQAPEHDTGAKHFLGESGRFDGTDIIDILMQQPATLEFLARKLLKFFAAPEPAPAVVAEAAAVLEQTRLNIKWFLRKLFLSRYFYSDACLRTRISSPLEYAVGSIRTLKARWPAPDFREKLQAMGQVLLAPPNVKGWEGERSWINASAWAARLEFAHDLSELADDDSSYGPDLDLDQVVAADVKEPAKVVDALAARLMPGDFPAEARGPLAEFLVKTDEGPKPDQFREDDGFRASRVRGALALVLSLPEYHAY
jgi:uncharacterized protein (DUF1800 family)